MNDKSANRSLVIWLLTGCVLIFFMVAIGGITRLTHSGLSMVEWTLFGNVPPASTEEWQILFDKYKAYPEYQQVNFNFSLKEFKSIFFWEYAHRMFGRFIGLVFIIPFFWFLLKKKISKTLLPKLIILLLLGLSQGLIGWYMVKSGLVKNPDVSHYRLALHLITAFITFSYTFWLALGLLFPNKGNSHPKIKRVLKTGLVFLFLQIIWGAYVAGLNAGKIYTTWPKMAEDWMPEAVYSMQPLWINFFENMAGVQFVHRYLAFIVLGIILYVFHLVRKAETKPQQKFSVQLLSLAVLVQIALGITALVMAVPVALGLLHQLGAFLLLAALLYSLHKFSYN